MSVVMAENLNFPKKTDIEIIKEPNISVKKAATADGKPIRRGQIENMTVNMEKTIKGETKGTTMMFTRGPTSEIGSL